MIWVKWKWNTLNSCINNQKVMYSCGPPHMGVQKQDDQHEHTFSNYVRIQDVVQKTCLRRWTIGKSGERGSGISVLPARHDDDDEVDVIFWFVIKSLVCSIKMQNYRYTKWNRTYNRFYKLIRKLHHLTLQRYLYLHPPSLSLSIYIYIYTNYFLAWN